MKRIIWLVILELLGFAIAASAQTISPLTAEYGKKADGFFTVQNNSLQPVVVTVEPRSFSADEQGRQIFRPLDSGVHAKVDSTSARIGPKSSHIFSYKVTCDVLPCSMTFLTRTTAGRTPEGFEVALHLPHTVYTCNKAKDCRKTVLEALHVQP